MTILEAFFLGLIQGLTEFLPISSSGHLLVAERLLNIHLGEESLLLFDILLHTGTLVALLIVYRKMWVSLFCSLQNRNSEEYRLFTLIVIGSIPVAIVGLTIFDLFGSVRTLHVTTVCFLITGFILLLGEGLPGAKKSMKSLSQKEALHIGIAQVLALLPGISRSGITFGAGRLAGLSRQEALDFSFLLAVPVIFGATLHTFLHINTSALVLPPPSVIIIGFITAFFSSICAIIFLKKWVAKWSFLPFALYLFIIAILLLLRQAL